MQHTATHSGFTDLRISHGARGIGDDSVWPSFTDIMTVIVMIFLMALVIIMVRNFELDRQLTTSVSARDASLLENQSLAAKLDALETRVAGLRESLGESVTERDALRARLLAELQRIEALAADNVNLEAQLAAIIAERNRLESERQQLAEQGEAARRQITGLTAAEAQLREEIAALSRQFGDLQLSLGRRIEALTGENLSLSEQQAQLAAQLAQVRALLQAEQEESAALGARVAEQDRELFAKQRLLEQLQLSQRQAEQRDVDARAEIEKLNAAIRRRLAENAALQARADAAGQRARSLQEEYDALDAKYRNLVRPARSPAGKYAVDVRFSKFGEQYRFQLREPGQAAPADYDRAQLLRRLAELKAQHGESLYTRVIIPESNQLTHNEAWIFTQEILQNYDYYYQQYPGALAE